MIELRWRKLEEMPVPDTNSPVVCSVDGWPAVLQYREGDYLGGLDAAEGLPIENPSSPYWEGTEWTDVEISED